MIKKKKKSFFFFLKTFEDNKTASIDKCKNADVEQIQGFSHALENPFLAPIYIHNVLQENTFTCYLYKSYMLSVHLHKQTVQRICLHNFLLALRIFYNLKWIL